MVKKVGLLDAEVRKMSYGFGQRWIHPEMVVGFGLVLFGVVDKAA